MNRVNIFEDMSDPIVLLNVSGDIIFSNKAARRISLVDSLESIRSIDFQQCVSKVLGKEVNTPVITTLNDDLGVEGVFEVKIDRWQSAFIIHFKDISNQSQIGILKKNLMIMLKDELGAPLTRLLESIDVLIGTLKNVQGSEENRALLNQTLEDGRALMDSVSRIKLVTDLYANKEMQNNDRVIPTEVIDIALQKLEAEINEKQLSVKVVANILGSSTFIGSKFWLILAIKECVKEVVSHCKEEDLITITLHLHGYFLTIKIDSQRQLTNANNYSELTLHDRTLFENIKNSLEFDFFLASRIIELHGGHFKSKKYSSGKNIIIELPVGMELNTPDLSGLEQAQLYAKDFAKLRMMNFKNEV